LGGKRLELITETVRKNAPVAVIWNPDAPGPALSFKELVVAAHTLKVQLQSLQVRDPNDFDQAFQAATRQASSLMVIPVTHLKRIVDLAAKYRLPAIYMEADFAEAGGLISY
jgi:putative tryptophan/tyrosine transport system substrate-binding protein